MHSKREPFYFVKDGKPMCAVVYAERPFAPENYSEVSPPNGVRDISQRLQYALRRLVGEIYGKSGVYIEGLTCDKAADNPLPKVYVGKVDLADPSLLGEATSYQFVIAQKDGALFPMAHTPRGYLDAVFFVTNSLAVDNDGKDVYLPAEAFGIYDREMPPLRHAFDKFTVSIYGPPYNRMPSTQEWLDDEKTFNDLIAFGVDEVPLYAWGKKAPQDIANIRALIKKFNDHGVTVRLYGADANVGSEEFIQTLDFSQMEQNIKWFVETYGDLDGISQWGFCDEPEPVHVYACAEAARCFRKYDPKQRPVYINMGPRAHCRGVQNFYDRMAYEVPLDYFCLDRYPFFMTERGPEVDEPYFYAHFELNRNYAVDYGRDAGMILAAIKVGADPLRADIDGYFMDWQTNLLLAYGHRYLEQYVYYYAHDFSILDANNNPTFRWNIAKKANDYLHSAGRMLDGKRLDAVFHLPNKDGNYDIDTIPYYGYREVGEVKGLDALLSFFDDGTIIVTDKRCGAWDGGDHDVTLTGITENVEWYDASAAEWEDISSCPAAKLGTDGLTLTLSRSTQYIIRAK